MSLNALHIDDLSDCISGSFELESPFCLTFGSQLSSALVEYTIYGDLSKPLIAVLGGISADQYVADTNVEGNFVKGWWDPLIGYNKAIDLNQFCVVSINYLDGVSSEYSISESELLKISTFDQATILDRLLTQLNISQYHAIIGASYGGMVALAFAEKTPNKVTQTIAICCTHKSDARNTALRHLQRQVIELSLQHDATRQGLELARALATLGYRGADEINQRFENKIDFKTATAEFPVVNYLQKQGQKFAEHFCPQRFIHLSLSVDLHQINPQKISQPCLLVGIEDDLIAPPEVVKWLSLEIGDHAKYHQLKSKVGHDGFLKEFDQLSQIIHAQINLAKTGQ